jgi:hypothetical protein
MAPAEYGMRGKAKVAHFLILKSAPPTIIMTGGEILSAPNAPQIQILLFDNAKPPERPTDGVKLEIRRLDDQLLPMLSSRHQAGKQA